MPKFSHFRAFERRATGLRGHLSAPSLGLSDGVKILDLGLGGARIALQNEISAGLSVELRVQAPDRWEALSIAARVAWVKSGEAGLAFEHRGGASVRGLLGLLHDEGYG
ncbi:MAG TPA: PilZ domain-containing protein [Polyangiaceae bacterium]|nr:PilZ domain-containing protein [Polyangiaceae bacterium]